MNIKELLCTKEISVLMEAHNALSALIVEKIGFKGIWASGFSISASCGMRDCNEMSWSQLLEIISYMTDSVQIPILIDADTGFGNYNNFRKFSKSAEKIGASGCCIEDKVFPKNNSFHKNAIQSLVSIKEFTGKIKAAKDSTSEHFCILARTEGFIAGETTEQVIERAHSYASAGADGIVVHSKKSNPNDIINFMKNWDLCVPIVIIPTSYWQTPMSLFQELQIAMIIYANYNIRACYNAMYEVSKQLFENNTTQQLLSSIATMDDIFSITGMEELQRAKKMYDM